MISNFFGSCAGSVVSAFSFGRSVPVGTSGHVPPPPSIDEQFYPEYVGNNLTGRDQGLLENPYADDGETERESFESGRSWSADFEAMSLLPTQQ